jgi:hypothetical protein
MRLLLKDNLPFASIAISYLGQVVEVPSVLLDTGSATTIFSADIVQPIQIVPSPTDTLYAIRGVGAVKSFFHDA